MTVSSLLCSGRFGSSTIQNPFPQIASDFGQRNRRLDPFVLKYRVISEPIHFPTGTETPFPIIRYASLSLPTKVNLSGTPCKRAYSRTVYGRTPLGNRESATSLVLRSLA